MCLIIDNCIFPGALRDRFADKGIARVFAWIESKGKLVIGGELSRELMQSESVKKYLLEGVRSGYVLVYPPADVKKAGAALTKKLRSNDPHVIGLGVVSGARWLWTSDGDLRIDWKASGILPKPDGKLVTNPASHAKELSHGRGCQSRIQRETKSKRRANR